MSWKSIKNMKTTTTRKSNVRKCSQKKRKKCNEKVSKTWNIEEEKTLNTLNNENNNNNKMYVNVHKKRSLAMIYCLFRACVDNFGRPRFRFCPIGMVLAAAGTSAIPNLICMPSECLQILAFWNLGQSQISWASTIFTSQTEFLYSMYLSNDSVTGICCCWALREDLIAHFSLSHAT